MSRSKLLSEQRGAKLKELDAIHSGAEKRALTAEEAGKFDQLEKEIIALDGDLQREVRAAALVRAKAPNLSAQEERDLGRFDLGKAIRSLLPRGAQLDGVELEVVTEGSREAREAGIAEGGLMLPRMLVRSSRERRDMTATGTTSVTGDQGGMTIATNKAALLDDFYEASVIRQAGATVLEGLVGNLDVPKYVAGSKPAKKTENASSDETTPTAAMLSLTPKRLPGFVDIGEQLLRQSSSVIEAVVRRNLTSQLLGIQEIAFFHGGGTSEANGVAGASGIGSVAGGTNGANPTWANIVALEGKIDQQNALLGNPRYVINAKGKAQLKTTIKNPSGTDSTYIISDLNPNMLNGYGFLNTNAVSSTLTKGTASGTCSAIFFGNFADYWVGYWGGLQLELLRDSSNAITGLYRLLASTYYDGGVARAKSFAAMLDALTPNA